MLLAVPKTKTKLYGDRSFAARAPRLWNTLPVDINKNTLCSASAIEYRDHIIVEYREYYHCYYYV